MTVLLRAEPRAQPCRDHQAICRLALRTHTPRCDFFPEKAGLTPSTLRSSGFRMAPKWPILPHWRRCDRRSIPDRNGSPPTSRFILPEILPRLLNPVVPVGNLIRLVRE